MDLAVDAVHQVGVLGDPRTPAIRRAATAEDQPALGRDLPVDAQVAHVVERQAVIEVQLAPQLDRQRLGRQHQRIQRNDEARKARLLRGERLGGAYCEPGLDRPASSAHDARRHPGDGGMFKDGRAHRLDQSRQAAHQLAGMNQRAMLGVEPAQRGLGANPGGGLRAVEQLPLVRQPEARRAFHRCPCAGQLRRTAGQGEKALLGIVRLDTFECEDAADLVHRLVHGRLQLQGGFMGVQLGDAVQGDREDRRGPATVATGSTEPDFPLLQQHHAKRRIALEQVVGRPQAGVAGADDDDIGVRRALQRRAGRALLEPERSVG
ncbi:hypothetical protein FQZ97_819560 [compost metagenome]